MSNHLRFHGNFPMMALILPEGQVGNIRLQHVYVSPERAQDIRDSHMADGDFSMDGLEAGTYAVLQDVTDLSNVIMSDVWLERMSYQSVLKKAGGNVLVIGLGIGMLPTVLCQREDIKSVTILELRPEVIQLIYPHVKHPKLSIILSDGRFPPFVKTANFDYIFIDIWDDIAAEHWPEMESMLNSYKQYSSKVDAWLEPVMNAYYAALQEKERNQQ